MSKDKYGGQLGFAGRTAKALNAESLTRNNERNAEMKKELKELVKKAMDSMKAAKNKAEMSCIAVDALTQISTIGENSIVEEKKAAARLIKAAYEYGLLMKF